MVPRNMYKHRKLADVLRPSLPRHNHALLREKTVPTIRSSRRHLALALLTLGYHFSGGTPLLHRLQGWLDVIRRRVLVVDEVRSSTHVLLTGPVRRTPTSTADGFSSPNTQRAIHNANKAKEAGGEVIVGLAGS